MAEHGAYSISTDGRFVAASVFGTSGVNLWVYETDGGRFSPLTFGGLNTNGIFAPDGASVIYVSSATQATRTRELRSIATSGGAPRTLATFDSGLGIRPPGPTSIRFDGSAVLGVRDTGSNNTGDVWIASLLPPGRTTVEIEPLLATAFDERGAVFSPDGRYIAYSSNESGQDERPLHRVLVE
jgi:Tol biopolymer transport system component